MLVGGGLDEPNEGIRVNAKANDEVRQGELVLVATPLGNLGDISRRALEILETADVIYCEDTRHSRVLFSAYELAVRGRLQALHEHNEASLCEEVVERVRGGAVVALVTDAGTPGISDPGSRVVAALAQANLRVTTVPGPSAVIGALSISGLDTERFTMEGFAPRKAGERARLFAEWVRESRTIIFFESPRRLATTLGELAEHVGTRQVAVVRELTKLHEEVVRGTVSEVAAVFAAREPLGEIVVVLAGAAPEAAPDATTLRAALIEELRGDVSVRDAAASVASTFGVAHRVVYQLALELRANGGF